MEKWIFEQHAIWIDERMNERKKISERKNKRQKQSISSKALTSPPALYMMIEYYHQIDVSLHEALYSANICRTEWSLQKEGRTTFYVVTKCKQQFYWVSQMQPTVCGYVTDFGVTHIKYKSNMCFTFYSFSMLWDIQHRSTSQSENSHAFFIF